MPFYFIRDIRPTYPDPNDPNLLKTCIRLRELDDVRPWYAVLPWLYDLAEGNEEFWEKIEQAVDSALRNAFPKRSSTDIVQENLNLASDVLAFPKRRNTDTVQGEFFWRWKSAHNRPLLDVSDYFSWGMPLAGKLLKLPSNFFEKIYSYLEKLGMGGEENTVPGIIKKYINIGHPFGDLQLKRYKHPFMRSTDEDYYVAGHIHSSSTHFLEEKKVYHCTGTWRTVHFKSLYKKEFKTMKSMNFIYFFRPGEKRERKERGGRVYIWRGLLEEE